MCAPQLFLGALGETTVAQGKSLGFGVRQIFAGFLAALLTRWLTLTVIVLCVPIFLCVTQEQTRPPGRIAVSTETMRLTSGDSQN